MLRKYLFVSSKGLLPKIATKCPNARTRTYPHLSCYQTSDGRNRGDGAADCDTQSTSRSEQWTCALYESYDNKCWVSVDIESGCTTLPNISFLTD